MEKKTLLKMYAVLALVMWAIVVASRTTGAMGISWGAALLGCIWIPAAMFAICVLFAGVVIGAEKFERMVRRRQLDRWIRARAEALGVWDNPNVLGGRALELWAKEHYGLKRQPGETDRELRGRCMVEILRREAKK